jgi:hypothetical protein
MKYRKKPVVIEAVQWTGDNGAEMHTFCPSAMATAAKNSPIYIPTLEGEMTAQVGDWIIRGVKGEYYPCKPDIFAATYEAAPESNAGTELPPPDSDGGSYRKGLHHKNQG